MHANKQLVNREQYTSLSSLWVFTFSGSVFPEKTVFKMFNMYYISKYKQI